MLTLKVLEVLPGKPTIVWAALAVALVALGANLFVFYYNQNLISQNKADLGGEVSSLQSTLSTLQSKLVSLDSQLSQAKQNQTGQAQELASIQTGLNLVRAQLTNLGADIASNSTDNAAAQAQLLNQLSSINSTLTSITDRLNAIVPSVPLTTLVMVSETYDSATGTFTLTMRNNLNVVVDAQITAVIYGSTANPETCDGSAGTFTSKLYQFLPGTTTSTQLPLSQGVYNGCGGNPISSVILQYVTSQTTPVSLAYTFGVYPLYTHQ